MKPCSIHNHSTGSDGKLSPEQVVKKAISLNWDYIYFTDHHNLPSKIGIDYFNGFFNQDYIKEIKRLKEKYKGKIEIYFGVELDWFDGQKAFIKKIIKNNNFDYVIGALHYFPDKTGDFRAMEDGKDYWLESARIFGGIKDYIKVYYSQIKAMINSDLYDCIAHLDYIKRYNKKKDLFSENENWYKKEIFEILDLIKEKKIAIEINAGGIRKCGSPFPSPWILKQAKKRNIPLALGLDAHWDEHYSNMMLKKIINIAKKAGYKKVVYFKKRKPRYVKI